MLNIVVVNSQKDWKFDIPDVEIIPAKQYLTDSRFSETTTMRVFNLCRSYKYQSIGYYVSLLAEARGHRTFPNTTTIQDLKSQTIMRVISDDIDELIQKSLAKLKSKEFLLNIYFGGSIVKQYDKLAQHLYNLFKTPLLCAHFSFNKKWILRDISPMPINEISETHKPLIDEIAKQYFPQKRIKYAKKIQSRYDFAILVNPDEQEPPSNKKSNYTFY